MARRNLPVRTTRGQLPLFLREPSSPLKKDKIILYQDPQQTQRKEMENKRRSQQIFNLRKYPYNRAYHYFFDLDTFPRVAGHISYAIDTNNALGNTYSNDGKILNQFRFGDVLNRKMFGLPINERSQLSIRKENRCKNVCYGYLFDTEDKKYQSDRLLTTLKAILKKVNKGMPNEQLKTFSVLTKDIELQNVLDQTMPLCEKVQILKEKIELLQKKKVANQIIWEADDRIFFYHALDQKLHNAIYQLKQKLSLDHLVKILYSQQTFFHQQNKKNACLKNTMRFYNTNRIVGEDLYSRLEVKPAAIFFFQGFSQTLKLAAQIIARRTESIGETHFYQAKAMVKKIFDLDLSLKSEKPQTFSYYQRSFRKCCDQVKKWRQVSNSRAQNVRYPQLERNPKGGQLCKDIKKYITGREYYLMMVFYWLCRALTELKPVIDQFPELVPYISSDYFPKVYTSFVEATSSALAGMMYVVIQFLPDLFSKPDPLTLIPIKLSLSYSSADGVVFLFREDIDIEANFRNISSKEEQEKSQPNKRFKYDNI